MVVLKMAVAYRYQNSAANENTFSNVSGAAAMSAKEEVMSLFHILDVKAQRAAIFNSQASTSH
jgi:hypothetical protein